MRPPLLFRLPFWLPLLLLYVATVAYQAVFGWHIALLLTAPCYAVFGWCAHIVAMVQRPPVVKVGIRCAQCGEMQEIDDPEQMGPAIAFHVEYVCPARHDA